jgi:hypothetical protein
MTKTFLATVTRDKTHTTYTIRNTRYPGSRVSHPPVIDWKGFFSVTVPVVSTKLTARPVGGCGYCRVQSHGMSLPQKQQR